MWKPESLPRQRVKKCSLLRPGSKCDENKAQDLIQGQQSCRGDLCILNSFPILNSSLLKRRNGTLRPSMGIFGWMYLKTLNPQSSWTLWLASATLSLDRMFHPWQSSFHYVGVFCIFKNSKNLPVLFVSFRFQINLLLNFPGGPVVRNPHSTAGAQLPSLVREDLCENKTNKVTLGLWKCAFVRVGLV